MLKNYLISALRNLKKNKGYTVINVVGLALGIGCALVIFKAIRYELSFDKHHRNFENIYRLSQLHIYPDRTEKGQGTPHPVGPALKEDYPDILEVARTHYAYGDQVNVTDENGQLNKFLLEDGIAFIDNSFFKIFTVDWIAGDKETALSEPKTVVLTQSTARMLFGLEKGEEAEAMGRLVNYKEDFRVVGIITDPPKTTNFPFKFLFEYTGLQYSNPYYRDGMRWNSTSSSTNTYILTSAGFDAGAFNTKLIDFVEKHWEEGESKKRQYIVQPFSSIHFEKDFGAYVPTTSVEFLYALGVIGIFLILTACINFINLATAQAANRSKEIGIRKAIGSYKHQLIVQLMAEISLITLSAVLLSLAIAEVMFILLEDIIGHRLTLDLLNDPFTILFLAGLFIIVSGLSGFYPSVLLSRMNTILALKSKITTKNHSGGVSLRKGLVITQFAISQFLIIGTLVISAQIKYFNQKDLGFNTEAILNGFLPEQDEAKQERYRNLLLGSPLISGVTFCLSQPTGTSNSFSGFNYAPLNSDKNNYHGNFKPVDEYYFDFFELELLAGRKTQKGDSNNVVINRKIADLMGFENKYDSAIGEKLTTGWNGEKQVVGVVENFHTFSLESELDYVLLLHAPRDFYSVSYKVASLGNLEEALAHIRQSWETVFPEYVFDYEFYDEEIQENYEYEQSVASLLRIFSIISILIGCLGLYGLISFIAINRTKEIGVRKVLGASVVNILGLFSREILVLTALSFLVAAPMAWLVLNKWMESYAYRISIGIEFFLVSFGITILIALMTISHRSISSAMINPALTLKDE